MSLAVRAEVQKRDRVIVMVGLAGVIALSWAYTVHMAWDMGMGMDVGMENHMHMHGSMMSTWQPMNVLMLFVMWAVMMIAMMASTVWPVVLSFASTYRQRHVISPFVPTAMFFLGYLLIWVGYCLLATIIQLALQQAALLSPGMTLTNAYLGGGVLIAAGLFQWTPIKRACLDHCRTPHDFLSKQGQKNATGALVMGLQHGRECVISCWLLMLLLFVAGVMNLLWMGAITALVLIEKIVPAGHNVARVSGLLFIVCGLLIIATNTTF